MWQVPRLDRPLKAAVLAACCWAGIMVDCAWAVNPSAWERWDAPLDAALPLSPLQAYHDVQIEATYWRKVGSTCVEPVEGTCTDPEQCFKGLAYWDGDASKPGHFMIRSAFPSGTWCWKTCLLPKSRPNPSQPSVCTIDPGLNQANEVVVGAPAAATGSLYSKGFLKAPASKRYLTYWNGQTTFYWLGDTAWNAPINYSSNPAIWKNYVTKRATTYVGNTFVGSDGFTNILVAPAVQTQPLPPVGGFRGFAPSGCSDGSQPPVVPTNCHYWDSAYWRDFDNMVKVANNAGIVLVIADVMDPLNRAGTNQRINPQVLFPKRADATAFARNLAARLAGSFVIFSPSFDARVNDPTAETSVTVAGLIDAVGTAIHTAAPRHLIGVHLGGASALSDYDQFQGKPWLSLQVFQSGHHGGTCESGVNDDYANFSCRARKFALRFRCIEETALASLCKNSGAPTGTGIVAKPAVNVEGQYETPGNSETRVQTRHTAWNSVLSGSFGFNIGVYPDITVWTNPTAYSDPNHLSDDDLGRMKGLFKLWPWTDFTPHHELLVEQNNFSQATCGGINKADWLQLWKPLLVVDTANGNGLAYLPRPKSCKISSGSYTPTFSIVLDKVKANKLGISCATWAGKWISPGSVSPLAGGFADTNVSCQESSDGAIRFSPAANLACGEFCDRVLQLTRAKPAGGNSPNVTATGPILDLETDVELSEDGQFSILWGRVFRDGLPRGGRIPLSGTDPFFRKLPTAALEAGGNFIVVWEEENASGTDDIVASRFDAFLSPLNPSIVLNDTIDGQQAEPWVSGDDSGAAVVVWTSYSEDGEIAGDIYGKVLDNSGQPQGAEFLVSTDNQGNQFMPQVQMDGDGGFVVAWNEEPPGDPAVLSALSAEAKTNGPIRKKGGVYYQVFGAGGHTRGPARRVNGSRLGQDRLSRLEVHRHGGFKIHWRTFDANGVDQGEMESEFDLEGNPK